MDSEKPEEKTDEEIRRETLDRFGHIIGKKVKFAMKDDKLPAKKSLKKFSSRQKPWIN